LTIQRALLIAIIVCLTVCTSVLAQDAKEEKPQISLGAAEKLMNERKFDEAKSALNALLAGMPAGWKPVNEKSDEILVAYWDTEHFLFCSTRDREQKGGKRIVLAQPSYSKAYYLLAYMSIESRNTREANGYIDKALELEPDHPTLLLEKGLILQLTRSYEEAVRRFDAVINSKGCVTDYEKARALRAKGVSLIDLGKLDEAEQALNESLKIAPNNKVALKELEYIRSIRAGGPSTSPVTVIQGR
jgi:tetratricopeptide (TPR) repeat protein